MSDHDYTDKSGDLRIDAGNGTVRIDVLDGLTYLPQEEAPNAALAILTASGHPLAHEYAEILVDWSLAQVDEQVAAYRASDLEATLGRNNTEPRWESLTPDAQRQWRDRYNAARKFFEETR